MNYCSDVTRYGTAKLVLQSVQRKPTPSPKYVDVRVKVTLVSRIFVHHVTTGTDQIATDVPEPVVEINLSQASLESELDLIN